MIKNVSIKDKDSFNEIGLMLNDNFDKLFVLEDLLENDYSYIYGYYVDNQLVGFLHVDKSIDTVDIVNIVVSVDYRGKKIATELLNHLFSNFDDVVKYLLEVKVTNIPAINLYRKHGFEIVNIRKGYYNGVDALVMGKEV